MIRDAELGVLVELCAAAIRGRAYELPDAECDGPRLLALARRHRVQGLAWLGLTGGIHSEFGPATELLEDTQEIARQNLLAVSAAARLLDEFSKRQLALVFLKGLTLGALAYPQAMVKMSTDVDALIDPAQLDAAENCLRDLGYEPTEERRSAAAKEWTWLGRDGVLIDLHARLADNPGLLPKVTARGETQLVEVSPGIFLPALPRAELFAHLCVHGTSSAWFRLKWVADLAAFLTTCDSDELNVLYEASGSLDVGRCLDVSLLVVDELFGPLIPDDLLRAARRDPLSRLLAGLSIRELAQEREPLDRPFGTVFIHLGQLFIDRGTTFPIREFGRQFSKFFS